MGRGVFAGGLGVFGQGARIGLGALWLLTAACAGRTPGPEEARARQGYTCQMAPRYSSTAVSQIVRLRDNGASRTETARRVGGTPGEIRCLEARLDDEARWTRGRARGGQTLVSSR